MKRPFRKRARSGLETLATELGLQASYVDVKGHTHRATEDGLLAVIRALGLTVSSSRDIDEHLRFRRLHQWHTTLPPVSVAWRGESAVVEARVGAGREWSFSLQLESGEILPAPRISGRRSVKVEGKEFIRKRLDFGKRLPAGYHKLFGENGDERAEGALFVAPERCYSPEGLRWWGLFAPLYALRSGRDWGVGDLADLADFDRRMRDWGGDFVGTLPMLAAFLDQPFEPSPYAPVSRLFWNELYLDVEQLPEMGLSLAARMLVASSEFAMEKEALRSAALVDYRNTMALKRRVLAMLAEAFFDRATDERRAEYGAYLAENPELPGYAEFRADKEGRADDRRAIDYHLYAQWAMHQQLDRFARQARENGPGLYLDYPLGVHPDGYDVASRPELFAMDASAGAPPDAFFTRGQSWGFPPMRPDAMREERFDYVIRCIRQQLRYAGMLRIDHIMGLHRLFWVPVGSEAKDGVYVRYPDQELFAILAIESHRHRSVIIGEDLGTVPEEIHQLMKTRGVKRMFVLQYELSPAAPVPQEPPQDAIASLNTHDMPMFHSFWYGRDIDDRAELGLLDGQGAGEERRGREEIRRRLVEFFERRGLHGDPLDSALLFLAGSDAEIVLLNLEDLWRESEPQNVPGTSALERPNWQRKLRLEVADAFDLPEVRERLRGVEQRRRG